MTKRLPFFIGYRPQFYFRTTQEKAKSNELRAWFDEESCARCGRNAPVVGYDWCVECRPELLPNSK